MSSKIFLSSVLGLFLTSAALAQNAPSPGVGIGIINDKRGYDVNLGPSDIGSPPLASSGVRTVDWVNAAEAVASGVTVASNTSIPDYPTGPIWRSRTNPFTEPGSAYVAWVQTTYGLTQQQISAIFTAAGGVMTTPSTGQQVQLQIPTPTQVGAAAIDLSNVNPTQGLAQLGAAAITLSNVNPATGRASIGVGSIGQLNTISGVPVSATTLSIGGVTSPNIIPYVSIKTLGAVGDGTTDDSAAFTAAFARTDSPTIYLPPGTYRWPCGVSFTAASSVSFIGAGQSASLIRMDAGCTLTDDIAHWEGKSGVSLEKFTLDLNHPTIPVTRVSAVFNSAFTAAVDGYLAKNISVINGVDNMLLLTVASTGGNAFTAATITNNFFSLTPGTVDNQSIAFTTVGATGSITGATVAGNVSVGTGIQFDGSASTISGNDVSGYKFGTGVFMSEDAGDFNNVLADNVFHDTTAGIDSNNTAFAGLEMGAFQSVVSNTICFNLGGSCIDNFGGHNIIQGTRATNIGINGASGPNGPTDQAGIALLIDPITGDFQSNDVTLIGNKVYDASGGAGTTKFGYAEEIGYTGKATLRGNDFSGATQALVIRSPNTASDAGFISTVSNPIGTSVASLAFAPNQGLDTASYHSWHLSCHDINPATAETVGIQVGEGSGGSFAWETSANYAVNQLIVSTGAAASFQSSTLTSLELGSDAWGDNNGAPGNFSVDLGNLAPAAPNAKLMRISASYFKNASNPGSVNGTGLWNGDTNAITALRVVTAGGDAIAGSCTLTGSP